MKTLLSATAIALIATTSMAADWTGGYIGAQIGAGRVSPTGGIASGSGNSFGLHGGYNYDFGDWVLGGEIDYDGENIDLGNPTAISVDGISRAKIKIGYDFGRALGYFVTGPARMKTSVGDATDPFYGLGLTFFGSSNMLISGEYLFHDFKNVGGTGVDAEANTFTIRGSFRF